MGIARRTNSGKDWKLLDFPEEIGTLGQKEVNVRTDKNGCVVVRMVSADASLEIRGQVRVRPQGRMDRGALVAGRVHFD